MVDVRVDDGTLHLKVRGLHQLWALKRRFEIPLAHVREVRRAEPGIMRAPKGIRAPGTYIPWVITAGTYHRGGEKVFWDVRNAKRAIVIELREEPWARLIVEVEDPDHAVALIRSAAGLGEE